MPWGCRRLQRYDAIPRIGQWRSWPVSVAGTALRVSPIPLPPIRRLFPMQKSGNAELCIRDRKENDFEEKLDRLDPALRNEYIKLTESQNAAYYYEAVSYTHLPSDGTLRGHRHPLAGQRQL